MAVEVERLIVALEARFDGYNRNLAQAQGLTDTRLRSIERRFDQMSARIKASTSSAALGLRSALGGLAAYIGVRQIKEYADSWTSVTRALEAGEQLYGLRLRSAEALNELANQARIDNDALAKLYIRTAAATRELAPAEEDVAKAATTVAKALKLGSASASEQTSTMLQLSQALQKGKLDGDEFRTVMENAGVIQELLADRLRVSKGEIVRMAAEGKLKVQDLFGALVDGAEKVDRIFSQMPSTIEEGFLVLDNNVEQYIGNLDKTYGTTEALVAALKNLSDNVEPVADSAIVLGAALLAAFSPRIIGGIAAATLGIAGAAGPLGLVAAGIAGVTTYADLFGDKMDFNVGLMREAVAQGADFETAWQRAFSNADRAGVTLQDTWRALMQIIIEDTNKALTDLNSYLSGGFGIAAGDVLSVMRDLVNGLISAAVFASKAIGVTFTALPSVIGEKVVDAVNTILRGIQTLIDGAVDALNSIVAQANRVPGVNLGFLSAPDLGQIQNTFAGAGAAASRAFQEAAASSSRDWVNEAGAAMSDKLNAIADRISTQARENALFRQFRTGTTVDQAVPDKPVIKSPDIDKEAEKARKRFEKDILGIENRIALEKVEAETIGRSAFEIERMRTRQELLNEARKAGIQLTEADMLRIDALSEGLARATTETENMKRAFQEVSQESKEMLSQFVKDIKNGVGASEALANVLDKISDKLIDMAVNDLVETALGGLSGRGGDASASALGTGLLKLFGFADGGVAAHGQPQMLPRYAGGGVARSASIFGEAGPEAAVPLPDGRRIPVELRSPNIPAAVGAGSAHEVITVNLQTDTGLIADIADQRVQTAAGTIVQVAVQQSTKTVRAAMPGLISNAQKRSL